MSFCIYWSRVLTPFCDWMMRVQEIDSFTSLSACMFSLGVLLTIAGVFVLARIDASVGVDDAAEGGDSSSLAGSVAGDTDSSTSGTGVVPGSGVAIAVSAGSPGSGDGAAMHITSGDRSFGPTSDGGSSIGYSRAGRRGTAPVLSAGAPLLGSRRGHRGRRGRRGRHGRRFTLQPTAFPGSFPNHARRRYSVAVLGVGIV